MAVDAGLRAGADGLEEVFDFQAEGFGAGEIEFLEV